MSTIKMDESNRITKFASQLKETMGIRVGDTVFIIRSIEGKWVKFVVRSPKRNGIKVLTTEQARELELVNE